MRSALALLAFLAVLGILAGAGGVAGWVWHGQTHHPVLIQTPTCDPTGGGGGTPHLPVMPQ